MPLAAFGAMLRRGDGTAPTDGGESDVRRSPLSRWELWIPAAYAFASALWISVSDLVVEGTAGSARDQTVLSIVKGFGFVAVTTGLLHVGLRWASARERATLRHVEATETLLRTVVDAIPDPVFVKDHESRWIYANSATLGVVGKGRADTLGKTDVEIYGDPGVGARLVATDRRIMDSGLPETVEETIQTPGGHRVFLSAKAPIRDAQGRVVGIVGNARDITDKKRGEEALRAQLALQDRFTKVAASVPGLVCSFQLRPDGSACMPFTTDAVDDLFGIPGDVLAKDVAPWAANVHPDDIGRIHVGVAESARSMSPWHDEYRYVHPTKGLRWIEGWSVPRREEDGSVLWQGFVMDVTGRKTLEEQFRQAQKMESIGRLAGGVAHDFNNLLTVILSCSAAIREDVSTGSSVKLDDIEEMQAAAERARDLTRQMLAFARKEIIAPVPLAINDVVGGSETLLRRLLGEDIRLVVRCQRDLWSVRCDPGQIEQVILNLSVNARDAMPTGGSLVIETSNLVVAEADPRRSLFAGITPGEYVRVAVEDTGTGIAADIRERIFEPFFTTKEVGKGTGLGLAAVYGIVKQSRGHIRVESEPGYGSRFEICFPRTIEAAVSRPAPAAPASARGTETVLLVEDDPSIRKITSRALQASGYHVLIAADGTEALDVAGREHRAPDLVITDVIMPGLDGRALASALLEKYPSLRVLYVSGYTRDVIAGRGLLDSGLQFLQKPFTTPILLERVRAVLDQ
jgi:two-component system cell cycle sensor histidine kinase/response regulator CckA